MPEKPTLVTIPALLWGRLCGFLSQGGQGQYALVPISERCPFSWKPPPSPQRLWEPQGFCPSVYPYARDETKSPIPGTKTVAGTGRLPGMR